MTDNTAEDFKNLFRVELNEGENKVISLKESIERYLKPGTFLHLGAAANLPYGFVYEITRQFWGNDARFKVSCLGSSSNVMIPLSSTLFHEGKRMIDEIITTYAGDIYPAPSPSRIFGPIFKENKVTIHNWSLLSMVLRFFAGAQNMPFIPMDSINGTSIFTENKDSIAQINNPFKDSKDYNRENNKEKAMSGLSTVLSPLNPDVAYLHGIWADRYGNTLLMPPYTGYMWGALASKKIIVSVEKIVDTETIRKYNYLARIPGHRVDAVVEIPFGAHPSANRGIPGVNYGYAEDYDFIVNWRKVTKSEDGKFSELKDWINKWVLHSDPKKYLEQLGKERVDFLIKKARPEYWEQKVQNALSTGKIDLNTPPIPVEIMAATMAQIGHDLIKKNGYKTILAGQGVSNLAAWLCHKKLLDDGYNVELMAEVGFYGYYPRPGSPFIFEFANFPVSKSLAGVFETLGYNIQGYLSDNVGFLGSGQVDKFGNINSTMAGNMYIVGSGGAADVCGGSKEVLVCLNHSSMRLIEKVPYITGSGKNVNTVITDMGILKKIDGELMLSKVFPQRDKSLEKMIKKIQRSTGWKLKTSEDVNFINLPDPNDIKILRFYDLEHNFLRI